MNEFNKNNQELLSLIDKWEPKLMALSEELVTYRLNNDRWTIKETVGHMVDSASNNIHRIIHLQYQPNPLIYPDYANLGNNDKWVAIQNYQTEKWNDLVQLWKYLNLHIIHVINNVNRDKLDYEWINALNQRVSLKEMIIDYLRHFKLHLSEIEELINLQSKP
ncbi:MAG TPA: DinB family protein [Bacillota bacterium]